MQDNRNTPWTERWSTHMPVVGFAASILFSVALVALTLFRLPSAFETALLQFVILLTGLWGTYIMGKRSALSAARELLRPHARAAFRRILSLQKSLHNLSLRIEGFQNEEDYRRLSEIRAVVDEQIVAGNDAIEDWRDIIPDDVDEMVRRYGKNDDSN